MRLENIFKNVLSASRTLNTMSQQKIDQVLVAIADAAQAECEMLIAENQRDLARTEESNPMYDRLLLTPERIHAIANDIRNVASLSTPIGEVMSSTTRPNGLKINKVRVPFGVVGVIYEARPNVSFDVFALCFKSKNACVLKGGSDAEYSNIAIANLISQVLKEQGVDSNVVALLPADREATAELMNAVGYVDVIIPRGSSSLIGYVRDNSRIPVIETGAGICHTYFDKSGDVTKGAKIVFNSKTRRVSVCNSLDCLIIHSDRLADLPAICAELSSKNVVIFADPSSYKALDGHYPADLLKPADSQSYGTEFLDYKMSIKTVGSLDDAIEHINTYSSKHSEAIVAEDQSVADQFSLRVDAACVYTNASTAFTDGGQFGFGAEIGISTQKLHARGPMALPELTSYKYIITGNGQVR